MRSSVNYMGGKRNAVIAKSKYTMNRKERAEASRAAQTRLEQAVARVEASRHREHMGGMRSSVDGMHSSFSRVEDQGPDPGDLDSRLSRLNAPSDPLFELRRRQLLMTDDWSRLKNVYRVTAKAALNDAYERATSNVNAKSDGINDEPPPSLTKHHPSSAFSSRVAISGYDSEDIVSFDSRVSSKDIQDDAYSSSSSSLLPSTLNEYLHPAMDVSDDKGITVPSSSPYTDQLSGSENDKDVVLPFLPSPYRRYKHISEFKLSPVKLGFRHPCMQPELGFPYQYQSPTRQ